MQELLYQIKKRYPNKQRKIDILAGKQPSFLSMCEDYDTCVNALHYWTSVDCPEAEGRVNEYRYLIKELENEIILALAGEEPQ